MKEYRVCVKYYNITTATRWTSDPKRVAEYREEVAILQENGFDAWLSEREV